MSEDFLSLSCKEQTEILNTLATKIGKSALILEKDIWLCWALEQLFKIPNKLPMAFKGGTSLSKVFRSIQRFSEDIDITLDYRALNCGDPFVQNCNKTQIRKISEKIKLAVTKYLQKEIMPFYHTVFDKLKKNNLRVELDKDGETLYIHYPSVCTKITGYVQDNIRLEFGGRNLTIPYNTHVIKPEVAAHVSDLNFPIAEVTTLSAEKTFWEKITLIHYECNRPIVKQDASRISRHWYDIALLATHNIGQNALNNVDLLHEVVRIKKLFYDSSYANYEDCLKGKIRLLPDANLFNFLKEDFNKMLGEKMFYGEQPHFNNIFAQIEKLEKKINQVVVSQYDVVSIS